jgi:outer membrane protein
MPLIMFRTLLICCFTLVSLVANAQEKTYNLEQCVEYAWLNNVDVRQSILNNESSRIDYTQSKANFLPNLSANAGQNYQFGRTIDRFTNQFSNQTVRSNNVSLNANLLLFNGLQNHSNLKQMDALQKASNESIENTKNQIALNVANAFLQIIQAEENIKNAEIQIESTKQNIVRAQKMVDAGVSDLGNLLGLKAQLANEELNLINAQNSRNSSLVNLRTLMQMPIEEVLKIENPELNDNLTNNILGASELYQIAVQSMPQIKAANYQKDASMFQKKSTMGNMSPTISLYGSLSTVYSQSAKTVESVQLAGSQIIGVTQNTQDNVLQPTFDYKLKTIDFNTQLKDNLGQGAGINLSWTLFNGFQVQNQIKKAKINLEMSELNVTKAKNTLMNEINLAVNNYNAAKASYEASQNNVNAQKLNLDYVQKRFEAGVSTSFDFIVSKNNYLQAQSNEIKARYELVFRGLILEYYKGNPIKI